MNVSSWNAAVTIYGCWSIQPTVDMREGPGGVTAINLESVACEIRGVGYINDRFVSVWRTALCTPKAGSILEGKKWIWSKYCRRFGWHPNSFVVLFWATLCSRCTGSQTALMSQLFRLPVGQQWNWGYRWFPQILSLEGWDPTREAVN